MLSDASKICFSIVLIVYSFVSINITSVVVSYIGLIMLISGFHELTHNPRYKLKEIPQNQLILTLSHMSTLWIIISISLVLSTLAFLLNALLVRRIAILWLKVPMIYNVLWVYIPFEYLVKARRPKKQQIYYPMAIE